MKWLLLSALLSMVSSATPWETSVPVTCAKLRQYCQACHGLGDLRFIHSENDGELWEYIFQNNSPKTGKRWAERILAVLDWPSNSPPPADQLMSPPDSDWMPKGFKRLKLAEDHIEGVAARRIMIETLRAYLR